MITSIFKPSSLKKSKGTKKGLQARKRVARDENKLARAQAEADGHKSEEAEADKDLSTSDQSATSFYDATGEVIDEVDVDDVSTKTSPVTTGGEVYPNKMKHVLGNLLKKFVHKSDKSELRLRELLCLLFSLQVPLVYVIRHIHVLNIWGAALVTLLFSVVEIAIAIPIHMVYMFLGHYGRRCYIKFWDCVPLFKGMAYSIAITAVIYELLNVTFSSLALLYMKNMFATEVPWIKCNFPNAHPDCVPTYANHPPYTVECCDEDDPLNPDCKDDILDICFKYGAADYYNSYILQKGYVRFHPENMILWRWAIAAIIQWSIIFVFLSLGLKKFRGAIIITHLTLMFLILVPGCLITLIVSPKCNVILQAETTFNILHETGIIYWLQSGVHMLNSEVPADLITFSSLSKPIENATFNTVFIYESKVLFLTFLSVWISIFVKYVQSHYNIKEAWCVRTGGDQFIFAIIPDVFARWPVPQLWLFLYFLIIFLWGLSTTTYALSSLIEAILDEFPALHKWRIVLAGLLSISACIANIFLLRPNFVQTSSYFMLHVFIYVRAIQLFLSLVAIFIYSLERFRNDYNFHYGMTLSRYWIHGLKIALIVLGFLFFALYVLGARELKMWDVYFILGLISPIIIGMVFCIVRYFLRFRATLLDPDPKWGPATLKEKVARARFDPTHELHFRSTLHVCKHNCLLTSGALKKEMKNWQAKQVLYGQQFFGDQEDDEKKTV